MNIIRSALVAASMLALTVGAQAQKAKDMKRPGRRKPMRRLEPSLVITAGAGAGAGGRQTGSEMCVCACMRENVDKEIEMW